MYINKTDVNRVIDYDKKYRKDMYTLTYDFERNKLI
jgi:hypothetical protein